jgi:ribonuclease J
MPDCVALAITTPAGVMIHTGDFKIDQTPIDGEHFDLHRFAELGAQGVLALFADSTNIDRRGFTGPEIEVIDAFDELFTSTQGSSWSPPSRRASTGCRCSWTWRRSSNGRWRLSAQHRAECRDRPAARLPAGSVRRADSRLGRAELRLAGCLCVTTGSQGEPQAALPRIAIDDHRFVKLGPDDTGGVLGARRFRATRRRSRA